MAGRAAINRARSSASEGRDGGSFGLSRSQTALEIAVHDHTLAGKDGRARLKGLKLIQSAIAKSRLHIGHCGLDANDPNRTLLVRWTPQAPNHKICSLPGWAGRSTWPKSASNGG